MVKMVIIAGNYREYTCYIFENELDKKQCPYVYHGDYLKGYSRETPILLVGSYINNPASQWEGLFVKFQEVKTVYDGSTSNAE